MILQLSPDSSALAHLAANTALISHIAGGAIGLAAGFAALGLRKGAKPHRVAGQVFFVSMLVMATVGAVVSPMLGQPLDTGAALFVLYLVATGWMTVRRPAGQSGRFERWAFLAAVSGTLGYAFLGRLAATNPAGVLGGYPPAAFGAFAILFAISATGDLRVLLQGGSSGPARIARHLWRMSLALLIATASFFLGQPRFQPEWLRGTPLTFLPELIVIATMTYWLVKLRLVSRPVLAHA